MPVESLSAGPESSVVWPFPSTLSRRNSTCSPRRETPTAAGEGRRGRGGGGLQAHLVFVRGKGVELRAADGDARELPRRAAVRLGVREHTRRAARRVADPDFELQAALPILLLRGARVQLQVL